MAYSSVVFNEGEPLDPNKLNQLQLNLSDVYKTSSSLYNATLNDQGAPTIPVITSGQFNITTSLGVSESVLLPVSPSFKSIPRFFCTIGGGSLGGAQITLAIKNATSAPALYTIATKAGLTITINWLAIENKEL